MSVAVFLDRDGVINKKAPIHEYIIRAEDVEVLPQVKESLERLRSLGFLLIVVTNQRCIALELASLQKVKEINRIIEQQLDFKFDDIFVCGHDIGACQCRKPKPGMLLEAAAKYGINLEASYMIGDSCSDVGAGNSAGATTIFIGSEEGCDCADYYARDLAEAATIIEKEQ